MFGNRELWEARSLLAVRSGVVGRLSETFPSRRVCLGSTSLVGEAASGAGHRHPGMHQAFPEMR